MPVITIISNVAMSMEVKGTLASSINALFAEEVKVRSARHIEHPHIRCAVAELLSVLQFQELRDAVQSAWSWHQHTGLPPRSSRRATMHLTMQMPCQTIISQPACHSMHPCHDAGTMSVMLSTACV